MNNIDHCIVFFTIVVAALGLLVSYNTGAAMRDQGQRNSEAMREIEKRNRRKGND